MYATEVDSEDNLTKEQVEQSPFKKDQKKRKQVTDTSFVIQQKTRSTRGMLQDQLNN